MYNAIPQVIVNQGPAAIDNWANTWIEDPANNINQGVENGVTVRYWYAVFHCFSTPVTQASITLKISNEPITGAWWAAPVN